MAMAVTIRDALKLLKNVVTVGDDLLTASVAWEEYKGTVNDLKNNLASWEEKLRAEDLENHPSLKARFEEAKSSLQDAYDHLNRRARLRHLWQDRCGFWPDCIFAWGLTNFLKARKEYIANAALKIEKAVPDEVKRQEDVVKLFDRIQRPLSARVPPLDSRYVPLRGFHDAVYEALNTDSRGEGRLVVFLHGEQGIGKTTMAWHIFSQAKESSKIRNSPLPFQTVLHVICGGSMRTMQVFTQLKIQMGLKDNEEDEKLFKKMEQKKKVLIILDDVQNEDILQNVIRHGGHLRSFVKFFITSNKANLCDNCDEKWIDKILIDHIDKDDARKILSRLTGLTREEIPQEIQNVMDKVVTKTQGNPFALTCFSSQISTNRRTDLEEWSAAFARFAEAMSSDVGMGPYQEVKRSFFGMIRLSHEGLGADGKLVLLLLHTLRTTLEPLVQLLYVRLGLGTEGDFKRARELLESKYLIKVKKLEVGEGAYPFNNIMHMHSPLVYLWSIHPLRKDFIEENGIMMESDDELRVRSKRLPIRVYGGDAVRVKTMGEYVRKKLNAIRWVESDMNDKDALLAIAIVVGVQQDFVPQSLYKKFGWARRRLFVRRAAERRWILGRHFERNLSITNPYI